MFLFLLTLFLSLLVGIFFYNYGWKDMETTSFENILRILKIMSFALMNNKKVTAHTFI